MKKTLLVLGTVAALVAVVWWADRVTRKQVTSAAKSDGPDIAEPAPEFTLKDVQDRDVSLNQFKGKVVLLNFWATWCDPCRIEIPWLIELQEKYGSRGLVVLGVAIDDEGKKAVAPSVEKERFTVSGQPRTINYPILIGTDDMQEKYGGLLGVPTSILITRDGRRVKRITGLISYEEIDKSIQSLL